MPSLSIFGVTGLPEITKGMDLADLIVNAANDDGTALESGDVVVIDLLFAVGQERFHEGSSAISARKSEGSSQFSLPSLE